MNCKKIYSRNEEVYKSKKYTDTAKDMRIFRNDVFNFEENNIEKNIVSKLFYLIAFGTCLVLEI